ncbi:RNA polymerase sigma factor [Plesiocystis pacifica SIR-1]|uniref:RNA polymerase sigma factor n=1 Tax=Plesiocystis pacifica SIR-1 TaxID=391625 RepID=A6G3C3_9BACT|nr:sigma-70 family RNA polymerase sigma factor [Plesiocystis pacifica]EDM79530.1 RNA polymerase sigma factor [Plesiocystis pacifica SIR-1]
MQLSKLGDIELVELWSKGNREAGNRLVKRYYAEVTRYFMNAVDDDNRRDLTQRTFAELCKSYQRFKGDASFRSYLFGISRNVLNAFLRERYRRREHFDPMVHTVEDAGQRTPSRAFSSLIRHEALVHCLRALPVEHKQLLELYYWHNLTADELAVVFDVPAPTIRTRVHNLKRRLKSKIAEHEPTLANVNIEQQLESIRRLLGFGPNAMDQRPPLGAPND